MDEDSLDRCVRASRLRRELQSMVGIEIARPKVRINQENHTDRFVRTPRGYVEFEGRVYSRILQNQIRYGRRLPLRNPGVFDECTRCWYLERRVSLLSLSGSVMALCREYEVELGMQPLATLRGMRLSISDVDGRGTEAMILGGSNQRGRGPLCTMLVRKRILRR